MKTQSLFVYSQRYTLLFLALALGALLPAQAGELPKCCQKAATQGPVMTFTRISDTPPPETAYFASIQPRAVPTVTFPSGGAPAPYSPSTVNIFTNQSVQWSGSFSSHPLTSLSPGPEWTTVNSGTLFTHQFLLPGSYAYRCGIHGFMTGIVHVAAGSTPNSAPVVSTPLPNVTATNALPFTFTFGTNVFTDADAGQVLSFTATNLPPWLSFSGTNRTFTGTPTTTGVYTVTVFATDNGSPALSTNDSFNITVVDTNSVPTPPTPTVVITGDFDADGRGDVLTSSKSSLYVLKFTGSSFVISNRLDLPASKPAAKALFVARGQTNFAVVYKAGKVTSVQLFTTGGVFSAIGAPVVLTNRFAKMWGSIRTLGDFNNDGQLDLLTEKKKSRFIVKGPGYTQALGPNSEATDAVPGKLVAGVSQSPATNTVVIFKEKSLLHEGKIVITGTNFVITAGVPTVSSPAGAAVAYSAVKGTGMYEVIGFRRSALNLPGDATTYKLPKGVGKVLGPR